MQPAGPLRTGRSSTRRWQGREDGSLEGCGRQHGTQQQHGMADTTLKWLGKGERESLATWLPHRCNTRVESGDFIYTPPSPPARLDPPQFHHRAGQQLLQQPLHDGHCRGTPCQAGQDGCRCCETGKQELNSHCPRARAQVSIAERANPLFLLLQEFLKVFERLRDEIVGDELLAGQPQFSQDWVKEVRRRVGAVQHSLALAGLVSLLCTSLSMRNLLVLGGRRAAAPACPPPLAAQLLGGAAAPASPPGP